MLSNVRSPGSTLFKNRIELRKNPENIWNIHINIFRNSLLDVSQPTKKDPAPRVWENIYNDVIYLLKTSAIFFSLNKGLLDFIIYFKIQNIFTWQPIVPNDFNLWNIKWNICSYECPLYFRHHLWPFNPILHGRGGVISTFPPPSKKNLMVKNMC